MKNYLLLLTLFLSLNISYSQTKDEVLAEAYLLYNSEKASWHGTDLFLEKFPTKRDQIGGYLSYTENKTHNCIFFDKSEEPKLLAQLTFNDNFDLEAVKIDSTNRNLNTLEKDLFIIRALALKEINQDTLFKQYSNTNLNLIPIITKKERKVMVLTGPKINGVVVFGNDYELKFNKNNKLTSKKALHKNIIPIEYNNETNQDTTIHNHLKSTGDLITSTDLCTLMLYGDYTNWEQHYVLSDKNVSIWDVKTKKLLVMTKKAWEKINKHQEDKYNSKK